MSLNSRARHLAQVAGVTFQQARAKILALGPRSAQVAGEMNWPLKRADTYLVDDDLDPECAAASKSSRYVSVEKCENCDAGYFHGVDKKGTPSFGSDRFCPTCTQEHGCRQCPRCGTDILDDGEDGELPCGACWDHLMSKD